MLEVKVIKEMDKSFVEKWNDFILNHPHGNFFQSFDAFDLFNSLNLYNPILIVAKEGENIAGVLLAILMSEPGLKGYFSKRCIIWGGPLSYDKKIHKDLLEEVTNYVKQKAIYTEFRNLFDIGSMRNIFHDFGYEYEERLNFIVPIESVELNMKKLNENRRRQIKKSRKSGTNIVEASNISQIKEFYDILKKLYTTKVKKPLPPFEFFENFYHRNDLGKYLLIEYNNKIIGGIMCPVYKNTIYEWYICGLDKEYKTQSPSVMATWAAIEYAANNGLKYFDFMGAGRPDQDYGVREFKSKFGGEEVSFGRYVKINKPFLYFVGKNGLKFYQKIKL